MFYYSTLPLFAVCFSFSCFYASLSSKEVFKLKSIKLQYHLFSKLQKCASEGIKASTNQVILNTVGKSEIFLSLPYLYK